MNPGSRLLAAAALLLGTGCASQPLAAPWNHASATYSGAVPCLDCPGIRLTVTLFPSGLALLHGIPAGRGRSEPAAELGSWAQPDDQRVAIRGNTGTSYEFTQGAAGTLRLLRVNGRAIDSGTAPDFTREPRPLNDSVAVTGLYAAAAGEAGSVTECSSGKTLPVAQRGQYLALRSAYLERAARAGETMLAALEARLVEEFVVGTDRLREVFVVTRVERLTAGGRCETAR